MKTTQTPTQKKANRAYYAMIERCNKNPNYAAYSVCQEWLDNRQAFVEWYVANYQTDYQIDKDMLDNPNHEYSPSTCMMVPVEINMTFRSKKSNSRGNSTNGVVLPLGVSKTYRNKRNHFQSHCKVDGKLKHLGVFLTKEAAHKAWQVAKIGELQALIIKYPSFTKPLTVWINRITDDLAAGKETKF